MAVRSLKPKRRKQPRRSPGTIVLSDVDNSADAAVDEAESISLAPMDEAAATTQPTNVGRFHHENEYDHKANEQERAWAAAGERTARDPATEAAGLEHQADDLKKLTDGQVGLVDESRTRLSFARDVFWAFTRREKGDKTMYLGRMFALLFGDIVGVAGAAILLGELPGLAIIQGISSGAAAVTSGVVGGDVKDVVRMRARKKHPDEMTDDQRKVAHHFNGAHEGEKIVKALVGVMLLVTLLIAGSIFTLRLSTQGSTPALAFALLAAAVSLASFLNSYAYADEIASLLSTVENTYKRDLKVAGKLIAAPVRRDHAEAKTAAESIKAEHDHQGAAAVEAVHALKHGIKRRHPGVAGHGVAAESASVAADDSSSDGLSETERGSGRESSVPPLEGTEPYEVDPDVAAASSNGHRGAS